jgi:hypothetical protein
MDLAFHFFMTKPENPLTQNELTTTLEIVLRKLSIDSEVGEKTFQWLSNAVDMINVATQRPKDDPLTAVNILLV